MPNQHANKIVFLNRLGALSQIMTDLLAVNAPDGVPLGTTASAALVVIGHDDAEPLMIAELAQICSVSHSVMVRTVDQLERGGYILRGRSKDHRAVVPELTEEGRQMRRKILDQRMARLDVLWGTVDDADRATLARLVDQLLSGLTKDRLSSERTCRMCDTTSCGADCPTELAARSVESVKT
jgi:DNA-binding MarR family transcriptional regulator